MRRRGKSPKSLVVSEKKFFFHQRGRLMVLGGKKLFFSLYPPKQAQRLRRTFALKQKDFSRKSWNISQLVGV
jgi:hypothetical protein